MSTIASWFASIAQAREAVLDLLTSGIPRQDISVIINASVGEGRDIPGGDRLPDFVEALASAATLALPDGGSVVVAGPLAAALVPNSAATAGNELRGGLIAVGVAEEQAQIYAEQLCHGGALVVVRSDDRWDTIVCGVFRHHTNPVLSEQEELAGPTPGPELAAEELGGPVSTSIGALTGGTIPGGWGEAGTVFEEQLEEDADEDRRRGEPGM
jgi:hypothetical protein